ncbi:heparinase II/III family protein [Methylobacterium currus]|uniref:heparinase II/III domain-containing protein n=1 Tax=Methylobacterium currus TaxID=2051553 RepID=UPI0022AAC77E|nr:heparinase II/III family protein [Methylobacterium currus]
MLPALLPSAPAFLPVQARYAGGAGPGAREGEHTITANNRWSRVQLTFRHLPAEVWCCLEARLAWTAEEEGGQALDFALAGFDFLAADGSSLDLDHVPGLARTLLDPHSGWIAGPACQPAGSELVRSAPVRLAFGVPPQARGLALTFRSWRNTDSFTIAEPRLRPGTPLAAGAFRRRRLGPSPEPLRHGLVPGLGLVVRGQIHAARPDEHAARVSLVYRDRDGAEIPPPYPGTVAVPGLGAKPGQGELGQGELGRGEPGRGEPGSGANRSLGAAINLPARPQARRFTLDLQPPPGATSLDLGFCTWEEEGESLATVELVGPPEVALEDRFRLESLCGDDLLDAPGFLARLSARLGQDPGAEAAWILGPGEAGAAALPLARARSLRGEAERPVALRPDGGLALRLAGCPDWALPEAPSFREDPFRAAPSRAISWRLAYQSLTWLLALAETAPARALALAQAWSRANPWGQPADPLSLHPGALPARAEVWIGLLALPGAGAAAPVLTGEAVRHGFALAEIVGQNTFGQSLHQLQAAAALLTLARALPRLPLSAHWNGLARDSLRDGVPALLPEDGRFAESSLHRRLDLVTLGRALRDALGEAAPGPLVAARTEAALSELANLLDPGGRLPPFGEVLPGTDDAGWIARLRGGAGLVAQRPALAASASSTLGPGGLSARHETAGRGWAHFACTFAETSPQGHADCTSYVYAAGATRWIVEAGGSEQVETGAARHYLLSARAHNVAVIEGYEPVAGGGLHRGSLALPGAMAHAIETTVHGPGCRHLRFFVLPHDLSGLAVIDRFTPAEGGPLTFWGLAHLAPETLVAVEGARRVQARQGGRRLGLVPFAIAGRVAGLETVIGRSDRPGTMQGFVVGRPGLLDPACTLRYAVSGRGTICGGLLMAVDGPAEDSLARVLAREELGRFVMGG